MEQYCAALTYERLEPIFDDLEDITVCRCWYGLAAEAAVNLDYFSPLIRRQSARGDGAAGTAYKLYYI